MLPRRSFLIAAASARALRAQPEQTFLAGLVPGRSRSNPPAPATSIDRFWSACDECSSYGVHHIEVNTINTPVAQTYTARLGEFKDQMAKRNLRLLGLAMYAHWHLPELRGQMIADHLQVARFLQAVGGRYIAGLIAPAANLGNGDEESYRRANAAAAVVNCNAIARRIRGETGIELGYHPEQGDLRTGLWKHIVEETDHRAFKFWPDVGHLVACGLDPLEIYRTYRSIMIGTHLRDYVPPDSPKDANGQPARGRMVPFGEGIIKLPELVAYLRDTKFSGCVMGEGGGTSNMRDYMTATLRLNL